MTEYTYTKQTIDWKAFFEGDAPTYNNKLKSGRTLKFCFVPIHRDKSIPYDYNVTQFLEKAKAILDKRGLDWEITRTSRKDPDGVLLKGLDVLIKVPNEFLEANEKKPT